MHHSDRPQNIINDYDDDGNGDVMSKKKKQKTSKNVKKTIRSRKKIVPSTCFSTFDSVCVCMCRLPIYNKKNI